MYKELRLETVADSGVLELLEIALSCKEPTKLKGFKDNNNLTVEIGVLTPAERKLAFFIQLLGDSAIVDVTRQNPSNTVKEYMETVHDSRLDIRIHALCEYLVSSIMIRLTNDYDPTDEICWDSEGVIYRPIKPESVIYQ